jgi:hypothetical protein
MANTNTGGVIRTEATEQSTRKHISIKDYEEAKRYGIFQLSNNKI